MHRTHPRDAAEQTHLTYRLARRAAKLFRRANERNVRDALRVAAAPFARKLIKRILYFRRSRRHRRR